MKQAYGISGGALAAALLGMLFCIWTALGNEVAFCVTAGCSLYQDLRSLSGKTCEEGRPHHDAVLFLGKRHDCDLALLLSNGKKFFFFSLFLAEGYPCQLCLFPK